MSAKGTASEIRLDTAALHSWLYKRMPHIDATPLSAERLPAGQSNPTWKLQQGSRAWVLRAKPGPASGLLPSAHAIEREAKVLRALLDSDVPVPRVHALCEDEGVIGVAFYVMDFVDGRITRDARLPGLEPAERAAMHAEAIRVLARLHTIDWRARGLSDFGRHDGYFERMLARWTRQYRATTSVPNNAMDALIEWLPAHVPPSAASTTEVALIHGDFRLENLIFDQRRPRILAVLDWELSTLGHPLSDLAYHCMAWHNPPGVLRGISGVDLAAAGIPTEREVIESYCRLAGRDDLAEVLAHWPFYLACNLFRLAAILQGIVHRADQGIAAHPQALETGRMADAVAELGWHIANGA